MSLETFTYTGSPWGYTAPGWTVFQRSKNISPKAAEALMPYFRYSGATDDPVKFVYIGSSAAGFRIVAQSLDCGLRWYDESRGHDYFAHVLCEASPSRLPPGFNPMSIFLSPDIQKAFPDELKKKAMDILNGRLAKEEPPTLDELEKLESISLLRANPDFSGDAVFSMARLPLGAVAKLPSVAATIAERLEKSDGQPILFDAANPNSLNVMAAALAILPPALRHSVSFATFVATKELSANSPFASFAFVGTHIQGKRCDPDLGIVGEIVDAGFSFSDADEAMKFAHILNATADVPGMNTFGALLYVAKVAGKLQNK